MNRRLTTDDVRGELREEGSLSFKDWVLDTTLGERLKRATDEYLASYGAYGFLSVVVPRAEARRANEVLGAGSGKRLLILTGRQGQESRELSGKS
jgi:hypothetical protein